MSIILRILLCIIAIILNVYIAFQFRNAAADKGYHSDKYFHLCFWCGIIGYLLVIALPDRGDRTAPPLHVPSPATETERKPRTEAEDPHFWSPAPTATATKHGECNIQCNNCRRIQFQGNRRCSQCGATFTHILH
jgi:hypothetical protein